MAPHFHRHKGGKGCNHDHGDDGHDHGHGLHEHHHHGHHHHHIPMDGSSKNIALAFFLNLSFTIVEIVGGIYTGSIAVLADAVHDFGDSLTLAVAFVLQKLSTRKSSPGFTYGLGRLSLLSALITGMVLIVGSTLIVVKAIPRFSAGGEPPKGMGMLALAVLGVAVNGIAAWRLSGGHTKNEKMLTWHMMEDLLGWVAVLIGAIVIVFTGWAWVDPLLAVGIACFVSFNVIKGLWETILLFLQGVPDGFNVNAFRETVLKVPGVEKIHDMHAWSIDGHRSVLSIHVVLARNSESLDAAERVKKQIRQEAEKVGKFHVTVETERSREECEHQEN